MGKFFIHIGLPKTATSTLQTDFFPNLTSETLEYLGVDGLRRMENSSEIYSIFMDAVETGQGTEQLRDRLFFELEKKSLILSEEMLTVSSRGIDWRKKIERVGKIVHGMDYEIIVTIREPVSALFSYYVELYSRFSHMSFLDCAVKHSDMQIYHYKKLFNCLLMSFNKENILPYRFEDIVNGNVDGLLMAITGHPIDGSIQLTVQNSRVSNGQYVVSRYTVTPASIIRSFYKYFSLDRVPLVENIKVKLKFLLPIIETINFKRIKVKRPSHQDLLQLKHLLENETIDLYEQFGIRYE